MSTFHGHVTDVAQEIRGSEATVDLAFHESSSLPVADLADFDETGGHVLVNGEVLEYTGTYGDDESDERGLLLAEANAVAVTEGDRVDVWNAATSDVVSEWVATVADDQDGSAIRVPLTHALIDMLGEGVEGIIGVSAACERDETGAWMLTEVYGKTPTVDLGFAEPGTIPPYAPSEKPATSPTVTAYGLPDSFLLRVDDDIDPTTVLQYQVSPDDGATWYDTGGGPIPSQILQVKNYGPDETPFELATDYVFRTQADNAAAGTPPAPSVASAAVQLDTSRVALIASEIIAAELNADRALIGQLSIGGPAFTLMPPGLYPDDPELNKGGMRIITATGAVIHFPADGSAPVLKGLATVEVDNLDATNLDVLGASKIGGSFTMGATITDPLVAPTVEKDYVTFTPSSTRTGIVGFCRNTDDDGWVYLSSAGQLSKYSDAGDWSGTSAVGNYITSPQGITRIGAYSDRYFVANLVDDSEVEIWTVSASTPTTLELFNQIVDVSGIQSATIGPDDAGNYILALETASGTIMRRYDTNGAIVGQVTLAGVTGTLGGVYYGSGDFGSARYVLQQRAADPKVYNVNVLQSGEVWPKAATEQARGLWWDGSHFWTVGSTGTIRRYETAATTPAATYGFSYDWRDSDTHHTGPSPETTFVRPKRARIKVTATVAPQVGASGTHIADRVQIYAATPNGGTKYPQGSALVAGERAVTLTTVGASGTAASANNWSGVTVAGYLDAATGGFKVDGNSDGTPGTGAFYTNTHTRPYAKIRRNTAQSMVSASTTTISWNFTESLVGGMTASASGIVVPRSGLYRVTMSAALVTDNAGGGVMRMLVSGSTVTADSSLMLTSLPNAASGSLTVQTATIELRANAGDTITGSIFQNNGANRNTDTTAGRQPSLSLHWMGPLPV